jgi:hypothetical protein
MRRVPTSIRVGILIAIVALVVFLISSSANDQREQSLLQHEASQAASVEQSTLSNVLSVLDTLATTTTISDGSPQAFQTEAQQLVHSPVSVALAKAYLSQYVVFAGVGGSFHVGQALNKGVFLGLHPTGTSVTTGPVVGSGNQSTATFAIGPPLVPNGNAIFLQFTVNPLVASILPTGPAQADIRVALYGSTVPARSNLMALTNNDPHSWSGSVVRVPIAVGDGTWTLVATAGSPLIGSFAAVAPLLILILGLLLAVAAAVIVETLVRRRRFAPASSRASSSTGEKSKKAAPVPQAPVPQAPVPQAPVPQAPVPQAPVPQAPVPQAPVPQAPEKGASDKQPSVPHDREESSEVAGESPDQKGGQPEPDTSFYADWRPDPFGRSQLRRFFLGAPTSLVRDGENEYYDPISPNDRPGEMTAPAAEHEETQIPSDNAKAATEGDSHQVNGTSEPVANDDPQIAEMHKTLDMVAARVAQTIAEEINELLAVASVLNEYTPETDLPPPPLPPGTRSTALAPPPTPPLPPGTRSTALPPPPVRSSVDPSEVSAEHTGSKNGATPGGPSDLAKTLLGTASSLWRRLRGDETRS